MATLKDLQKEASKLGIEGFEVMKYNDLRAAVSAAKSASSDGKPKGVAPKNATVAHVVAGDNHIRTYSLNEHGDNFAELAAEFASKDGDRKVVLE